MRWPALERRVHRRQAGAKHRLVQRYWKSRTSCSEAQNAINGEVQHRLAIIATRSTKGYCFCSLESRPCAGTWSCDLVKSSTQAAKNVVGQADSRWPERPPRKSTCLQVAARGQRSSERPIEVDLESIVLQPIAELGPNRTRTLLVAATREPGQAPPASCRAFAFHSSMAAWGCMADILRVPANVILLESIDAMEPEPHTRCPLDFRMRDAARSRSPLRCAAPNPPPQNPKTRRLGLRARRP